MAGFTNAATRLMATRFGAALTFTEMTNAAGLDHASDKTWQLLETLPGEGPVVAHLYGARPEAFAAAALRLAPLGRFCAIDLNAGCPVRKITCGGAGAALMADPPRIGRIVAAIRAACDLPVTVKTRLGPAPGSVTVLDVLREVERNGGAALIVHARYVSQGHTGAVDLALLAEVKRLARIPVVGNGGITDAVSARRMLQTTGVDAVMVGQAAIGNPWMLADVASALSGGDPPPHRQVSLDELRAVLYAHLDAEIARLRAIADKYRMPARMLSPEEAAVIGFRCHFFRYLTGLKGVSRARGQLSSLRTMDDVRRVVDACLAREAAYRAHVVH
ncbi:MAG: tRNA-dihydrouridine synthase family protein [Kiritimatiellae bacterium]|nr:tRNA-dihydrouridine synthase family protein [Kiritimatiellia bacterium]